MSKKRLVTACAGVWCAWILSGTAWAQAGAAAAGMAPQASATQAEMSQRIDKLSERVNALESKTNRESLGAVALLFGAFCALWAQNTRRNPWVWFFAGAIFNVFAVFVVLVKNSEDLAGAPRSNPTVLVVGLAVLLLLAFVMAWCVMR